jgi:hypothetical protein
MTSILQMTGHARLGRVSAHFTRFLRESGAFVTLR